MTLRTLLPLVLTGFLLSGCYVVHSPAPRHYGHYGYYGYSGPPKVYGHYERPVPPGHYKHHHQHGPRHHHHGRRGR